MKSARTNFWYNIYIHTASRFALMEAKAFLFTLLCNFKVNVTEKTQIPLKLVQTGFGLVAEKGYYVHLEPRQKIE